MNKQLNYKGTTLISFIILLFIFISCKQKESNPKEPILIKETVIDSVPNNNLPNEIHQSEETISVNGWLEPIQISDEKFNTFTKKCDFKKAILTYYNTVYDEKIKEFKKEGYNNWSRSKNYIESSLNDSFLEVKYNVTETVGDSSYDAAIVTLKIPLKPDNFVFGDLNNDQNEDCLITVFTEGNWALANGSQNNIFIFLNKGNNYKLTYVFTSSNNYNPVLIENNQIIANELSYAPKDPRCCPSLHSTDTTNLDTLKDYLKIIN